MKQLAKGSQDPNIVKEVYGSTRSVAIMRLSILIGFLLLASFALGQAGGVFQGSTAIAGNGNVLRTVPHAQIVVCGYPSSGSSPCTNTVTTYTTPGIVTACPLNAPVLIPGTTTCSGTSDAAGNFSFIVAVGQNIAYYFKYLTTWYGPYVTSIGIGGGAANFASPPPLGNVTPNTVDATTLTAVGDGLFFQPQSNCIFEGSDPTLHEIEDVSGKLMWLYQGLGGPCTQILTYTPLPDGVNPTDKQVPAWDAASGAFTIQTQSGSGNPAFSALTSASNTTAAMTVGTGASMNTSGTGSIQATGLPSATVSALPTNLPTGTLYEVTDGITTGDCTNGGGVQNSLCKWNGANWSSIGDGGGVSTLPGTVNLGLSYNMSCATVYGTAAQTTTNGTVTSGSTSVLLTSATGFAIGQAVFIVGAGTSSGPYNGLITNVVGSTLTVTPATGTTVTGAAAYNYSAPAQTTTSGLVNSASTVIPVANVATFFANQGILIAGAGAAAGNYIGTIQSVNIGGSSITVTPATSTSVTNAVVEHDESAALNSAITALAGGQVNGTLYAPAGICLFNGPLLRTGDANAIIPMPNVPYDPGGSFTGVNGPTLSITIQGATIPSWANYNLQNWSTIPTSVGTIFQTTGAAGNFIGAKNPNEGDNFTAVHLTLHNLIFRAPDNPAITMVNCLWCIGLNIQDAAFDTLANGAQAFPSQPTHSNGQAFIQPSNANDAQTALNNIRATGWFTVTNWTEHTDANHIILYANWQGILCNVNTGASNVHRNWAGYVDLENNAYGIVGGASLCYINIEALDTELNLAPSWVTGATSQAQIYDPNNMLTGMVKVNMRKWYSQVGGTNLQVLYTDVAPTASGGQSWVPWFIGTISSVVNSPFLTNFATAVCGRQTMEITLTPSIATAGGSACTTTGFNFTGKTVSVRVPSVLQSNANQYTLLEIGNDQSNLFQLYANQTTLNFKKRVSGTFTTIGTATYTPNAALWWQISESSGAVTASYSADGITWTPIATCAATCVSWAYTSTNISVEAVCVTTCPANPGYAKFDNFSVNYTAPIYPRIEVNDGLFGSAHIQDSSACETGFATSTLSTVATTTDTGLNCLPINAVIDSVVYRITTTITTAANFTIGDPTTAARFCSTQSTLTSGTTGICFVQADQTGAAGPRQTAAAKVRVTTNVNPGAGAIRLIVYYHTWTAPTS